MKTLQLLFGIMLMGIFVSSCHVEENHYHDDEPIVSIEDIMTRHEVWYVDYNNTIGAGNVPFVSKAFTLSFYDGVMYANNNIVGLGFTGGGFGITTGTYSTSSDLLQINHDIDGIYTFEVIVDSHNHIRLYNAYKDVTYYLDGYSRESFDYDRVYYDNIEYFLQEYIAWRKVYTSETGDINDFDYENYLAFIPENNTTFYSSQDAEGALIDDLIWDFEGNYEISNITGYDNLKYLTLDYDDGYLEEFELSVLDDTKIELYHLNSGTTYEFQGNGFIQYKNRNYTRARKIIKRKSVTRKQHKVVTNTRNK